MKIAVLLVSGAAVLWVLLALFPVPLTLFGRRITFDYGIRRQCGALAIALALTAAAYAWKARLLPLLMIATAAFFLAELLYQCGEDAGRGTSRKPPQPDGGEAVTPRRRSAMNRFHLVLQLLLIMDFVLQCLLLRA